MDADAWNARYDTDELVWGGEPNLFLPAEVASLTPGRALDLACGEGRNAVWLASQGWDVTGVDFSSAGVAKGEHLASEHGAHVTWVVADATTWAPPAEGYDLVIVFYLQLPAAERCGAVATAVRALAPEGTFLLVAHDLLNLTEGHGGPGDAGVLTTADAVVDDLASASLAHDVELVVERAERVDRMVSTPEGERSALDTLVRARRLVAGPVPEGIEPIPVPE